MLILIIASSQVLSEHVAAALKLEDVDAFPVLFDQHFDLHGAPVEFDKCALIIGEQGVISVGEQIGRVRDNTPLTTQIILCTHQPSAEARQTLLECGASEVITPETWSPRHIAERIGSQLILCQDVSPSKFGRLRGATKRARELYRHIGTLAPLSETILILGETGTGKELVAREIHELSHRPDIFVPVNCPEISPELFSSELFGHTKGAFTGADRPRHGLIAEAKDGTVFLDEIGDLDLQAQAKLLRFLEERRLRRVGSDQWEDISARVILATNLNLEEACRKGEFRRDLYERIRGFTLELSPLRERKADIPLLAQHFVDEYNKEYKCNLEIPAGGLDSLFRYQWPGNVRELRAVIRKAAAYSNGTGSISTLILQETVSRREGHQAGNSVIFDPFVDTWRDIQQRLQNTYFRSLLSIAGNDKDTAIKLSGLSRSQFYEKLREMRKDNLEPGEDNKTNV
jgi:two-component system, NtrC family, response regulator AtoC